MGRPGRALLLAAAFGTLSSAASSSRPGQRLPDESCLVQASAQPTSTESRRPHYMRRILARHFAPGAGEPGGVALETSKTTSSEDGMLCDSPIADPSEPRPNYQLNFKECKDRQKAAAEKCGPGRCDLIFVGDSIFERLGGEQCYLLLPPGVPVLGMHKAFNETFNLASHSLFLAGSGDTTQQTMFAMDEILPVMTHSPKAFLVMVGTNNIGNACAGAEQTVWGIKAVVSKIRELHPRSKVLVHNVLNRAGTGCCGYPLQPLVDDINVELKEAYAGDDPYVSWVDCSGVFPKGWDEEIHSLMPDKLHPSIRGYREWMQCLNSKVHKVMGV